MKLELMNIKKKYGKKQVLRGLCLTVPEGACVGIVGANGCGKSTLLKILAGTLHADGGTILIDGKPVNKPAKQLAGCIGYVPQESILIPELTVADNLKLWAGFGNYAENLKTLSLLQEQFRLKEFQREKCKNLSGGMTKRVNIACALIRKPSLLLMDEPSADLDLLFKEELKDYIRNFTDHGGSVLISSHDRGEIAACDSLWAIKNGAAEEVPKGISIEKMITDYIR